ncbi:hypothetical protein, partial [Pseudoflavonifractor phocaeensis]|uniref:hypothetical protein n=1 Tax=Pseudoflavonifractor phocaeensis TaxID=1870988 RepID=UPI00195BFB80
MRKGVWNRDKQKGAWKEKPSTLLGLSKKPVVSDQNESILREECRLPQDRFLIFHIGTALRGRRKMKAFFASFLSRKKGGSEKGLDQKGQKGGYPP